MSHHALIAFILPLLLLAAVPVYADNSSKPLAPPPKPALDVTMKVVPLNADIEKTVVQIIIIPVNNHTPEVHTQTSKAHPLAPAARQPAQTGNNPAENARESVIRQTAEAQREAEEAAKEARKDSNNSSKPDNDGTPP